MSSLNPYAPVTVVPRIAVHLPLELPLPQGFAFERAETWPEVTGRLEYVKGRLQYMPPCGELQQRTVADVLTELNLWRRAHAGFVVGGNEAGMLLGGEVRAADAAIWDAQPAGEGFARRPPRLAVEVTGIDEALEDLEDKAAWYLSHGVEVVWLVIPTTRSVHVVTAGGRIEVRDEGRVPEHASLPGLSPRVADFFQQV